MSGDYTKRMAFAAVAILVATGCTTSEADNAGCAHTSGFDLGNSELRNGTFHYGDKTNAHDVVPLAVARGAEFTLSYEPDSDGSPAGCLRAASSEKLERLTDCSDSEPMRFRAITPGMAAVLAPSPSNSTQIVDLVHMRILAPSKIRPKLAYALADDEDAARIDVALAKGTVEVPSYYGGASFKAEVLGEVDEANGALGDDDVGSLVPLRGLEVLWETSDADVVDIESRERGEVYLRLGNPGAADVTMKAGSLSQSLHVVVKEGW